MFLLLIAGIILLATHGWFSDQHMVGLILTIVGALTTIVPILLIGIGTWAIRKR